MQLFDGFSLNSDMEDVNSVKVTVVSLSAAANIVLNSLVIAVIVKTPKLREDRTTLFVFSLAVSGLAFGICCTVSSAIFCSRPEMTNPNGFASIYMALAAWFTVASLYNLCCISVCKMVAVVYPLRYLVVVTERRCYIVIFFNWIVSASFAAPFYFIATSWSPDECIAERKQITWKSSAYMFALEVICCLLPMSVMIYANVRMFVVVARVTRQVSVASSDVEPYQQILASALIRSVRSSRNIIIICFAYVFLVMSIVVVVTTTSISDTAIEVDVKFALDWLFFAHMFINSFLYIVLHRSVRVAVKELFRSVR